MPTRQSRAIASRLSAAACVFAMLAIAPVAVAQTPAAPPQPTPPAAAAGQTPASKGLPIWVVRDADSTIYMTGTVHLLPDGLDWHSDRFNAAFNEAGELYLELAEIADPSGLNARVMPIVERYAQWDGKPLSTMLTEKERALLSDALKRAEAPADVIAKTEKLQPWYAAYALGREQFFGGNYKKKNGVDVTLAQEAISRGIPVKGMEKIEDQIILMTGLTPEEQVTQLRNLLHMPEETKKRFDRVSDIAYRSWARGEVNAVEGLAIFMSSSPDNDAVLLDRNEAWAAKIEDMLKGSGVTFIAVGAAHLVGPNSVQARLKLRGIKSERYE